MADKLLSVNDSSIRMVANAINNKRQNNSSMEFPDGFIDALNELDTYSNAIDKVEPQTVTLTPSNPTYNIPAGAHDGSDVVKIVTQNKTVTPTTSEIEVLPDDGKFLGTVTVNAIDSSVGHHVKTGTVTLNNVTSFRVSNIGFTPTDCILFLQAYHATSSLVKIASLRSGDCSGKNGTGGEKNNKGVSSKTGTNAFTFSDSSMLVSSSNLSTPNSSKTVFAGTYYYVIWR